MLRGRTKLTPRYLKQSIGNTRPKQAKRPFFSTKIVDLTNSPLTGAAEHSIFSIVNFLFQLKSTLDDALLLPDFAGIGLFNLPKTHRTESRCQGFRSLALLQSLLRPIRRTFKQKLFQLGLGYNRRDHLLFTIDVDGHKGDKRGGADSSFAGQHVF